MNILQVNTRLSEGGAAQVARTLEIELGKLGHNSFFLYGYGKSGKLSNQHLAGSHFKYTKKIYAGINLLIFRFLGREKSLFPYISRRKILKILKKVDIIHLHVVHSYFIDFSILISAIIESKLPVVWTFHDEWVLTGRCANPGSCKLWEMGCVKCPDLNAYPPAYIDRAHSNFKIKREKISAVISLPNSRLVTCANWLEEEMRSAGFSNLTTITNSIDSEFQNALMRKSTKKIGTNIFICRDLRDRQKIDWELLLNISNLPNQSLTIVGDFPPVQIDNAKFIPSTSNRAQLASLMQEHRRLIFTSRIDTYPLTIVEALTAGLEVYTLKSKAAMEFKNHPRCFLFDNAEELYNSLEMEGFKSSLKSSKVQELNFDFSPRRMALEYEKIYKSLLVTNEIQVTEWKISS